MGKRGIKSGGRDGGGGKGKKNGAKRGKIKIKRKQVAVVLVNKERGRAASPANGGGVKERVLADPRPLAFGEKGLGKTKFLGERERSFASCLKRSYCGFEREKLASKALAKRVEKSLERLRACGYFHYDLVQYGSKVNVTRVQRTLVGNEGMTYLYQKLRLFALPWSDTSIANGALVPIRELNAELEKRSKQLIESKRMVGGHVAASAGVGRCDFNLTLINAALTNVSSLSQDRASPPAQPIFEFKEDKRFNAGPIAVNWHRDSTLEPFSTIGVYHHTPDPESTDWSIAMCCEQDGIAPPLRVSLNDTDCYYMLGNFNHHHQHAVLAGETARYASTHRVAVTHDATFECISKRCATVLKGNRWTGSGNGSELTPERVRVVGELAFDLEFDWIRQFYVQGSVHAEQHKTWWKPRIEQLFVIWGELEKELFLMVQTMTCKASKTHRPVAKVYKMMLYLLSKVIDARLEWKHRLRDSLYRKLPQPYRPINRPDVRSDGSLPSDLSDTVSKLETILSTIN
mmetsp:Transcript_2265/g.3304  ORF Transcript_2265/g.3304 Transcript_2265/m.3304 type:complete len:516 (-) Transcript_2265:36-1583(-)